MKHLISISSSIRSAESRIDSYNGKQYRVFPVISAVGDSVIFPANAPYPEFVPSDVLALATESRNFRPVVMNHPVDHTGEYCSANSPGILEMYHMGFVFNAKFEGGKVKSEIWIDEEQASNISEEAKSTVQRLIKGEVVEVSEGSYVIVEERSGIHNGDEYQGVWTLCIPDHLAILPEGVEGACSVNKHGCGTNRVNAGNAGLKVSALNQARTPTFSGTESSSWSAPSFSDYIKYLHPGESGPKSVSQCSMDLKEKIAAHSLLGDPNATSMSDLTMLPCVNPANGKLNEKALRNITSGKGMPDDMPESIMKSAQDMAQRLLNSEFGSKMEASKMADTVNAKPKSAPKSMLSRMFSLLRDNMSNNKLRDKLWSALYDAEPGMWMIEDYDTELKTVVYTTRVTFGDEYTYRPEVEIHIWQRSYNIDANDNLTLNDDRIEVEYEANYVPVKGETASDPSLTTSQEHSECKCKKGVNVSMNKDQVVTKLIASGKFKSDQKAYLMSLSEGTLKALSEETPEAPASPVTPAETPAVNEPADENKSADRGQKTIDENKPKGDSDSDTVSVSKADYEVMKAAAVAYQAAQSKHKESLVKVLSTAQGEYKENELKSMDVQSLERMCSLLKVNTVKPVASVADYTFARATEVESGDDNKVAPVISVSERIRAAAKKAS